MRYPSLPHRVLTTSIAAALITVATARASTWKADVDGNWSDPLRWDGGVPNAIDAVADASTIDIFSPRTIFLDGSFTVGTLRFGDLTADNDWFLDRPAGNNTNVLTLNVTTGSPTIQVVNRNATISAPLAGTKGLTKTGAGVLFLTGDNTYTGTTTVSAGGLVLGDGGTTGSLQTTQVVNTIGTGGAGAPGGFEIRRSNSATISYPIVNPTNNQASGAVTINTGTYDDPTSGLTLNGVVRQNTFGVGRGQFFGRVFVAAGADISIGNYFFGEQAGRTGQGVQSGGTVVIGGQMRVGHWPQADPVTGTANTTTPSTYTMSGGTLTLTGTFTANPQGSAEKNGVLYLGVDSTGELTLNGGVISAKALVLDNRGATNGTDRLTINGGTLRVGGVGNGSDADTANIGSAIISNNTNATYAVSYTGGTIQAAGNFLHAVDATLDNANGGITFDSNGAAITVTGVLSGTGGLTKTGAGTLTIKSAASYTGNTTVTGGTLSVLGNLTSSVITVNSGASIAGVGDGISTGRAGTVTIAAGGALAPGAFASSGSIGNFTAGSITTSGDARFDLSPTATTIGSGVNDLVAVTGTLTFNTGSLITPVFASYPTSGNTYLLFTSTTRVGVPQLNPDSASRLTYELDTTTQPNNVLLKVTGSGTPLALTWKGNGTTNLWDVNSSSNWNNNTQKFFSLDTVTFDDSGDNAAPVNLVGSLQPGSVTVNAAKNYTFAGSGLITGAASLTKSGTGVLTINNAGHSFSGAVSINGGTLVAGSIQSVGQPSAIGAGNAINISGGTLRYTGGSTTTNRTLTLAGTGGTLEVTTADSTLALSTPVGGTGKLTKTGPGSLAMPGGNTYDGGTEILGGTALIGSNNNAFGTSPAVRIDNGARLEFNGITGNAATVRLDVTVGANGGTISNAGGGVVNNPLYGSINLEGNLTIDNVGRYDLNGGAGGVTINGGTFSITKTGPGETWWAPNLGATLGNIIVNGGTFGVQSSDNLGSLDHAITVNSGGQLVSYSGVTNSKPIILNGGLLAANNNTGTWLGTVTLNGAGTTNRIGTIGGVGVTIQGQVTGANGFETTAGTVDLQNATNNYQGDTLISGGILRATLSGALPATTTVVLNGGALDLGLNTHTVAGLRGSGGTIQGFGTLAVNQSADTTFGGAFTDTALNKSGPGRLTLTGTSTSTEANNLAGGGLVVNGALPGPITVTGGSLEGKGTVGALTLNAAGRVAPGDAGAGILTAGNTSFAGGTFALELNGATAGTGYDQLNVAGSFTLTSNTPLTLSLGYDPADQIDSFVIVSNDGTDLVAGSGLFTYNSTPLGEGAVFSAGGQFFRITYAGGSNSNDVVLQAIPEPATAMSLLGGVGLLMGFRRSRRSRR